MFETGELIVYGSNGVCRVAAVETPRPDPGAPPRSYYTLAPVYGTETIYVPVDAKVFMRPVLTREEAEQLVLHMPQVQPEQPEGGSIQALSRYYQEAFDAHDCQALVRLLKTIHNKNSQAQKNGKHPGKLEERYQKRAEDLLYGELAVVLGIPRDEVLSYIKRTLEGDPDAETA